MSRPATPRCQPSTSASDHVQAIAARPARPRAARRHGSRRREARARSAMTAAATTTRGGRAGAHVRAPAAHQRRPVDVAGCCRVCWIRRRRRPDGEEQRAGTRRRRRSRRRPVRWRSPPGVRGCGLLGAERGASRRCTAMPGALPPVLGRVATLRVTEPSDPAGGDVSTGPSGVASGRGRTSAVGIASEPMGLASGRPYRPCRDCPFAPALAQPAARPLADVGLRRWSCSSESRCCS